MRSFPDDIKFRFSWRSYQHRVLSELDAHLDDGHLHIIAAPGSGKTVLGLEVIRQLNKPALILSPTLAIRDQWVDRFVSMFCPDGVDSYRWISRDIKNPGFMTTSTYQGLHSAYTGKAEKQDGEEENDTEIVRESATEVIAKDELIRRIQKAGVKTIVVDEAHHLRSEWWKCLIDVKRNIDDVTVVALTATPPYDVSPLEWQRYRDLCGPVDSEICVPELVREKNLCPHQDYVYMSTPVKSERAVIEEFRQKVKHAVGAAYMSGELADAFEKHRCLTNPQDNIEEILADPGFYSLMAFFLHHGKRKMPHELLKLIGVNARYSPKMDLKWMEPLLTGCLFTHKDDFQECEFLADLSKELKRAGAIERRKVNLHEPKNVSKLLVSSISKLDSICKIVDLESRSLGDELRMVILTDYIRKADLPKNEDDIKPLKRIGVVPIFEKIRRQAAGEIKLGCLSGSFVVIPAESKDLLEQIAGEISIDAGNIRYPQIVCDLDYCQVQIAGPDRQKIVKLMTMLFNRGGVTVLVGTKSLLGEGWDAPSINSLVLASFVGSYMLSNQMRGRAIRTEHGNPSKTANVWHLVCVEPGIEENSQDMETLIRRFRSFSGVAFTEDVIVNGIERLDVGQPPYTKSDAAKVNEVMTARAVDRDGLRDSWIRTLEAAQQGDLVEEISCSDAGFAKGFVNANMIKACLWQGVCWVLFMMKYIFSSSAGGFGGFTLNSFLVILSFIAVVFALAGLPFFIKSLYLFVRHYSAESSFKMVGRAVLKSMAQMGVIETPIKKMRIRAAEDESGAVACSLEGATTYEKSLFLDAMQEILGEIDNPRYIFTRKSLLGRRDFHSVPQMAAKRKETAEMFVRMWGRYVGSAELVYTRSEQGRLALLKARGAAMSEKDVKKCERVETWK